MSKSNAENRRVLVVAHACHPDESMETRLGWRRAVDASGDFDVTVLHASRYDADELTSRALAEGANMSQLRFVPVGSPSLACLGNLDGFYWAGYRAWHCAALRVARKMHQRLPFDLVHQVTYCGYREPGRWWKLGVPFVWGPVGGTQNFPVRYISQLHPLAAFRELARNAINHVQLRHCPRVRNAARNATTVIAATRAAQHDLLRGTGVVCHRLLETGVDTPSTTTDRNLDMSRPFRILWSGRLREWKALPLLLEALAKCPGDLRYQLRVMGVGSSQRRWQQLAQRLGVAAHIEWVGWPSYQESLAHYAWADAFAFTSLRDTSGTGLLESLAAGTPIIGVDHQGAHDIMTAACALPVAVANPSTTIAGFATAISQLASDPVMWQRLSRGARKRAEFYSWHRLSNELNRYYAKILVTRASHVSSVAAGELARSVSHNDGTSTLLAR